VIGLLTLWVKPHRYFQHECRPQTIFLINLAPVSGATIILGWTITRLVEDARVGTVISMLFSSILAVPVFYIVNSIISVICCIFLVFFNPNVSIVKVYNVFLSGNSIIFTFNSFLLMLILNYESHFYILLLFSWTSFILALRVWYFGLLQYAKLKRFSVILLLLLFFLCSLIFTYKGMMLYYETT